MKRIVSAIICTSLASSGMTAHADGKGSVTQDDMAYLRGIMRETWHYIDAYRSPITGLPYDSNEAKDKTNTTNVGLYLASLCMAYRLGYLTEDEALARATKILDSLDRFQNWHRLYGNWLDPDGKQLAAEPGESNISDYNKLPASLVVVRQTFPELRDRCSKFLDEIPWEKFYEPDSGAIDYEFNVALKRVRNPVYFFRGEDKILGHFLMIASGKVPASSWDKHNMAEEEREGYRYYMFGWQGGGLFMHFICGMFLDDRGTLEGRSSANFAWAQIVHANRIGAPVWGWSACVAPSGEYLGMDHIRDEIVTPHACALAIHLFPREAIDNLRRLEEMGLRKPFVVDGRAERYGFRDSVNWATGDFGDKYLVLDQAMLFLSLVNFCEDGLLWKTFGSDPLAINGADLIAEYRDAPSKREAEREYVASLSVDDPGVFWMPADKGWPYRPGQALGRTLYARSLSRGALDDIEVSWKLAAADGTTVSSGVTNVDLAPRETREVATVEAVTETAKGGDVWTLTASCSRNGRANAARTEEISFDTYRDLSGAWFAAKGDNPAWASPALDDTTWKRARVPARWEDTVFPDYDGTAWFRLRFHLTEDERAAWRDRPLAVAFGGIDDADETYLNGTLIGSMGKFPPAKETAYNAPRLYPIERDLLATDNVIAVRISDWQGNGGIWRGPVAIGPSDELRRALNR